MIIEFVAPAPRYSKFDDDAFNKQVGKDILVKSPTGSTFGRLLEAMVRPDGGAVALRIRTDDDFDARLVDGVVSVGNWSRD